MSDLEHYRSPDPHGCGLLLLVTLGTLGWVVLIALAWVVLTLLGWL